MSSYRTNTRLTARSYIAFATLAIFLFLQTGAIVQAEEIKRPKRFIYNSDGGNIFIDKKPPMKPR